MQDVAVMDVAVQDDFIDGLRRQQRARRRGRSAQHVVGRGIRQQCMEPVVQRHDRRRLSTMRMQPRDDVARDAHRVVVMTRSRKAGQRRRRLRAFEQDSVAVVLPHLRGALPVPPGHQRIAATLFVARGDLQHRGSRVPENGQQAAARGQDRAAVGNEAPQADVSIEHHAMVQANRTACRAVCPTVRRKPACAARTAPARFPK